MLKKYLHCFIVFLFLFSCQEPKLIIESKSDNSYLTEISVNGKIITGFSPDIYTYDLTSDLKTVTIAASGAKFTSFVAGTGEKSLNLGKNQITISVYSESDEKASFYYLNIYYFDDSSTYITDLKINGNSVDNFAYDQYVFEYPIYEDTVININPITINKGAVISGAGDINLDPSSDSINLKFTVTSKDTKNSTLYTVILNRKNIDSSGFYNMIDLSYEFQKDGYKTVICGDSLSVGYGFFNGGGFSEAKDTYSGILSWAHLIRDAIIRSDPYFIHADQLMIGSKSPSVSFSKSFSGNGADLPESNYWMPLNNRNIVVTNITSASEEIIFRYTVKNHITKKIVLYFSKTPYDVGCSFDIYVDNTLKISDFNTTGNVSLYNGFELTVAELSDISLGEHEVKLTNFKNTNKGTSMGFFMLGAGSKYSPVFLTGKSGVTTKFFVDNNYTELNSRIINNFPDMVILTLGANDSSNPGGIPSGKVELSDYYKNLRSMISKIKEKNRYTQVLLISPPLWNGVDENYIKSYGVKMKTVAVEFGCMFLDTAKLLENFPPKNETVVKWRDWRVDDIHFTHYGNTIMARNILSNIASYAPYSKEFIDADMVFTESNNMFIPEHGWLIVKYNSSTGVFEPSNSTLNYSRNFIKSISRISKQSKMEIKTFKADVSGVQQLNVEQYGSNSFEFYTRSDSFGLDYRNLWILKRGYQSNGTDIPYLLTDADFVTYAGHLNFLISW